MQLRLTGLHMLGPATPQWMQASVQPFNNTPHPSFPLSIMLSGFCDATLEQKSSHSELGHQSRLSLCISYCIWLLTQISKHSDHELCLIHGTVFSPLPKSYWPQAQPQCRPGLNILSHIKEAGKISRQLSTEAWEHQLSSQPSMGHEDLSPWHLKNSHHIFLCYVGNSRRADTMNS